MRKSTMASFDANALDYIRFVMSETGLSASALAKEAGLATTTLTRALNNPDHKFGFSLRTLEKISKATGIEPKLFLEEPTITELTKRV